MTKLFGAIDLGATSGRVIAGLVGDAQFELIELHRFENRPVETDEGLFWNFEALLRDITAGIAKLGDFGEVKGLPVHSVGIDTWAVDFGALDAAGRLLVSPRHYRDVRNQFGVADIHSRIDAAELFKINGLQHQPFNTIFQLAALRIQDAETWRKIDKILLLPDLIAYFLTGAAVCEVTNASTTGLFDVATQSWSHRLLELTATRDDQFARLLQPGSVIGGLLPELVSNPTLAQTQVVAVASHDTASAVVGSPLPSRTSAFLSSGTWSLLGLELDEPVLTDSARVENFTNELGAEGRIRYLKNLSGLWLLSQSIEQWQAQGGEIVDLHELLTLAANEPTSGTFDVTDDEFFAPGDIPARIQVAMKRAGHPVPQTRPAIVRVILESLAKSYGETVTSLRQTTGIAIDRICVVGGGSANALLCQLTANATGLPVSAGPAEATAIGNLLIQATASGLIEGNLEAGRNVVAERFEILEFQPQQNSQTQTTSKDAHK